MLTTALRIFQSSDLVVRSFGVTIGQVLNMLSLFYLHFGKLYAILSYKIS
jgi:hypothetical protein